MIETLHDVSVVNILDWGSNIEASNDHGTLSQ